MADEPGRDGWRDHAEERRRAWLKLTPARRLELLEAMKAFCREALGAAHPELRAKVVERARKARLGP